MRIAVKRFSGNFENFFEKIFLKKFSLNVNISQKSEPRRPPRLRKTTIPKSHPNNRVAFWFFGGACMSGQGWGIEPLTPQKWCVLRYHHLP